MTASFQEILQLKRAIGLKKSSKVSKRDIEVEVEESELEDSELEVSEQEEQLKVKKQKKSKNAPQEISSKKSVSRKRKVVESADRMSSLKKVYKDPRFEPMAGSLNPGLFQRSYSFLHQYQDDEITALKKETTKERDPTNKAVLKGQLDALVSRRSARMHKEKQQVAKREWRKSENDKVVKGKKPFFLKKSDMKKEQLKSAFTQISQSGSLDKFLEKKRKRNAAKEHTRIPKTRRSVSSVL